MQTTDTAVSMEAKNCSEMNFVTDFCADTGRLMAGGSQTGSEEWEAFGSD